MSLNVTVLPSKQFAPTNDDVTVPKLNLLGTPTITVSGNLNQLDNVSATAASNTQPLVWNSGTGKWEPGRAGVAYLGNGSPVASLFLRGDGNWADPTSSNASINLYLNQNCF